MGAVGDASFIESSDARCTAAFTLSRAACSSGVSVGGGGSSASSASSARAERGVSAIKEPATINAARRETCSTSSVPSDAATSVRYDDARVDTAVRGRWTRRHLRPPSPVPTHRVVTADACGRVRAFMSRSRPARPRPPSVSDLIVSAPVNSRAFWQNVHPSTRHSRARYRPGGAHVSAARVAGRLHRPRGSRR